MKQPPNLFPRIPYTRQRGRLSDPVTRGADLTYTGQELVRVRARLLEMGGRADCPRCHRQLLVRGPTALRRGGHLMWTLRCGPCGKHANIRVQTFAPPPAVSSAGLVVSQPKKPRLESRISLATAAIVAHAAAIVIAVLLTIPSPEQVSSSQDTAVVFISVPSSVQPRARPLPPPPRLTDLKIQGFKMSLPPLEVPTETAAIDPTETFDRRDYSGVGVEGSAFARLFGDSSGSEYDPNRIWPSSSLPGEPPRLIKGPRLIYPPWMRDSGIEGFVVLQFVIDTAGLAEQQTIEVIRATHEGFVEPALHIIRNSLYRPGRVRGRPVRVLSQIHINFALPDTSTTRPYPLR